MKKSFIYSSVASTVIFALNPALAEETVTEELEAIEVVGTTNKIGTGVDFLSAQSNALITEQQIQESGSVKVDDILKYESGVNVGMYGNDTKQEWIKIRGFDPSLVVDGAPATDHGFYRTMPNTYGIEAIEIVKGADSVIYGGAQTGGLVNVITKRPTQIPQGEIGVNFGTQGYRGVFGDYSGSLNTDNSVRYRLVGDYYHREGDINGKTDNYYIAPSLTWDINKDTGLTVLSSFSRQVGDPTSVHIPANGSLFATSVGTISRSTDYSEPNDEYVDRKQMRIGYEFSHNFGDGLKFTQNYQYYQQDLDWLGVFAWSSDGARTAYRGYSYTDGKMRVHTVDNRLSKEWKGDNWNNTLLGGIDYIHSKTTGVNNGFGTVNATDLFNPVSGNSGIVKSGSTYNTRVYQTGYYLRDQFKLGHFVGNLGFRHDKAKGDTLSGTTYNSYNVSHNSYQASAMYNFDFGLSPYVSYSESFRAEAGVDGYGNPYKPYEGRQYEAGVKYLPSWIDGKISAAYFDLEEKNALVADVTGIQLQIGKRNSKGIEVQADAYIAKNWNVALAYTYTKAEQDVSAIRKVRASLIPRHQASAQLKYRFTNGTLDGVMVGAGVRYVGTTVDEQYFSGYKIPSYTLVDLMVQYDFADHWRMQLNVNNLADKKYLAGCDYYCYFGAERSITGSISYKF
ncbi:iron complex outermembrane receptor protein [Cricetibacter osteomyelitidis]|uniref:Iron complex outermembrane receptor protein n=1 Tax=Cricetibacter osteomyelitidis TaxID=1521931 RepID=A0A4R2T493_9PAST|nr:TonB-dependent siderophore receptor [Cricetibacter osteomyelitidis]TCP97799.1 iron complex outermembrane receptor protein [Cricetibacter osteomyelitidis]